MARSKLHSTPPPVVAETPTRIYRLIRLVPDEDPTRCQITIAWPSFRRALEDVFGPLTESQEFVLFNDLKHDRLIAYEAKEVPADGAKPRPLALIVARLIPDAMQGRTLFVYALRSLADASANEAAWAGVMDQLKRVAAFEGCTTISMISSLDYVIDMLQRLGADVLLRYITLSVPPYENLETLNGK